MGESVGALTFVGIACAILVLWADGDTLLVDTRIASMSLTSPSVSRRRSLLFDFGLLDYRRCHPLCINMIIDTRGHLRHASGCIVLLAVSSDADIAM